MGPAWGSEYMCILENGGRRGMEGGEYDSCNYIIWRFGFLRRLH